MQLTREEEDILQGKYGAPAQKAMEVQVALGECYDAKRMIPVTSAHLLVSNLPVGKGGVKYMHDLADKGARFSIFTDSNPRSFDPWLWRELDIDEQLQQEEADLMQALHQMGCVFTDTCAPYLAGNVPLFGEHIAWSESSAIVYANSVLGARTNREGGPSAIAAAITGRVPEYGYHLDENRYGELKIVVTAKLADIHDYGTLGYFTGKIAQDRVPVFTGIQQPVSQDALKALGSASATSGSVALFHVVGVTPEARDEETALGGEKLADSQIFEFGEKDLRETEASLCRAKAREIDAVLVGCPHASITEIRDIARELSDKKLKPGTIFWIFTSRMVKTYAQNMGYIDTIEDSGARIICDSCPMPMVTGPFKEPRTFTVVTNSPKTVNYINDFATEEQSFLPYYGSLKKCVEVATTGTWR